jgi:hypothetical protein
MLHAGQLCCAFELSRVLSMRLGKKSVRNTIHVNRKRAGAVQMWRMQAPSRSGLVGPAVRAVLHYSGSR